MIFWSGIFWSEPLFQTGSLVKTQNRIANGVDPDEMAHYE